MAKGIGEIATVSREATVDTHVDARVASNLYAARIQRGVSGPVDKGVSAALIDRGVDGFLMERAFDDLLIQRSVDSLLIERRVGDLLVERSNHDGHDKFREGCRRRHDVRIIP